MPVAQDGREIVCEFYGIQITTKNPNIARILSKSLIPELKWTPGRKNDLQDTQIVRGPVKRTPPSQATTINAPVLVP